MNGPAGSNTETAGNYITVTAMPDTTPPTAPGGRMATPGGYTTINLNWITSTDSVGVAGHRVQRCQGASCTNFAQIATPPGATCSDTGRTAGTTYGYRVRAVDAVGNLSTFSAIATVTATAMGAREDVDFDANLDTDLVWRDAGVGTTSIWLMNNGVKPAGVDVMGDANWVVTRSGDFDGDGKSDLIRRNSVTGTTALWLMNGASIISASTLVTDPGWSLVPLH